MRADRSSNRYVASAFGKTAMRPLYGGVFEFNRYYLEKPITTGRLPDMLAKFHQLPFWKSCRNYANFLKLGIFWAVNKLRIKMLTGQAEIFLCCPEREKATLIKMACPHHRRLCCPLCPAYHRDTLCSHFQYPFSMRLEGCRIGQA